MEFTEVIKNRYSCKKYGNRKLEAEKLNAILETGRLAPTAKNLQEHPAVTVLRWSFVWHLIPITFSPIPVRSVIPVSRMHRS